MTNKVIQKAISIAGSQQKLASMCGVKQPTVWRWLHGGRVDISNVMSVVKATNGKVQAHEIRPDIPEVFPHTTKSVDAA
ncbi:transcriptional regulator [Rahnella inusitata]|jgi:DNA-binding transcriptional regulator YdaS (Cro superfamily)|uniref:transcriptional regulator n=1 Tax=Rahnella inusitata TaxID=58169 RepID=UPI0039BEB845